MADDAEEDEDLLLQEAENELDEDDYEAEEMDYEEALAAAQEGARTWTRARQMLRKARTSRGFFRPSGQNIPVKNRLLRRNRRRT